jgi:UDP-N-acetylenolpyruvoylglucosamine reductase
MPAVSKKQQRFFGIVRAIQKGEMAPTTPETAKAAKDMKKGDVKDFASTKHKKLPEKIVKKEETELDEYYGMPGGMGSSRSKGVRDNEKYQKSKDRVDSLLAAVRRGREKRKKMKEETDYKSRNKILKRAKPLHKHLYKNLHKKDTSGDVNENKKSFKDFLGDIYNSH